VNNYLDGTYNKNQILYLRCQNEKQKETKTKKRKKQKTTQQSVGILY
jgi:hypothetical protein